jgi:hypothetical protein
MRQNKTCEHQPRDCHEHFSDGRVEKPVIKFHDRLLKKFFTGRYFSTALTAAKSLSYKDFPHACWIKIFGSGLPRLLTDRQPELSPDIS